MSFLTDPLVYYPISAILWFWHKVFTFIGDLLPGVDNPDSNGVVWALSVIFLVVTLRILLYWPAARQIRFGRKMQEMQPKLKALEKRYKNDRQKLMEERRKLQQQEKFNPLLGCLPMFIQIPVFLGLFHVLRSFNRMGDAFGALGMSAEETRSTGNYVFSGEEVQSFLDARLFGAPLSSFISQPVEQFQAFVEPDMALDFARWNIWLIALPLMIVSALTTHFNAKLSISRQSAEAAANPQAAIMNRMMLWVFPIGILATGAFWPVAILVYMVVNNLWTYAQQHYLYQQMAKEDDEEARRRREHQDSLAPKPGVKPVRPDKRKKNAPHTPAKDKAGSTVVDPDRQDNVETALKSGETPEGEAASAADASPTGSVDEETTASDPVKSGVARGPKNSQNKSNKSKKKRKKKH